MREGWPGAAFVLFLFFVWELSARWVASPNFPGAFTVLSTLATAAPTLLTEMGITLWRAGAGLLLALVVMLPLGIFIGRVRAVGDFVEPLFDMLRPLPPLAIVPVAMLFAGVGSGAKVLVIFYSVSFPIVLSTIDAVRSLLLLSPITRIGRERSSRARRASAPCFTDRGTPRPTASPRRARPGNL